MKKLIVGIILVVNVVCVLFGIYVLIKTLSTPPIPKVSDEETIEKNEVKKEEKKVHEFAVLKLNSYPPKAKVFVNGYYKGKTPVVLKIMSVKEYPKIYRVKLLLIGYQIWEERVSLKKGDEKEFTVKLLKG